MFANRSNGYTVATTSPGEGEVITAPPTSFVVNLSDPYDPSSVAAGDLTVNGIPADAVAQTSPTRLTFTFAASPVVTEGVQTLAIAGGEVLRFDGQPILPFTAAFRHDLLRLAVDAADPVAGSVAVIPFTTLTLTLNESVDAASIGINDLTLSAGTVTAAVLLDPTTVQYTLSGVTAEQDLTVRLPAGVLTDPTATRTWSSPPPTISIWCLASILRCYN